MKKLKIKNEIRGSKNQNKIAKENLEYLFVNFNINNNYLIESFKYLSSNYKMKEKIMY